MAVPYSIFNSFRGSMMGAGIILTTLSCKRALTISIWLFQEGRSLTIKLRKRKTEKKVEWSS